MIGINIPDMPLRPASFTKVWVNKMYMVPVRDWHQQSNNEYEDHQRAYRRIKQALVGCGFDWVDALVETHAWPVRIYGKGYMRSVKYSGQETFVTAPLLDGFTEDFYYACNHGGAEPPLPPLILD